jgi:hypothetical protein
MEHKKTWSNEEQFLVLLLFIWALFGLFGWVQSLL